MRRALLPLAFASALLFACAMLGKVPTPGRAEVVRDAFSAARVACHDYEGTGGKRDQSADQLCLALLLGDHANANSVELDVPEDAGADQLAE